MPPRRSAAAGTAPTAAQGSATSDAPADPPSGRPKRTVAAPKRLGSESEDVPSKRSKTDAAASPTVSTAPAAKGRGRKHAVAATNDDLADSASSSDPASSSTVAKGRGRKATDSAVPVPAPAALADEEADDDKRHIVKKVIRMTGKAPVDEYCSNAGAGAFVYDENGVVWDCALNQTDVSYGVKGHNKFYLIQLIGNAAGRYAVWTRWGRVGAVGQSSLDQSGSLESAKAAFASKFSAKTGNHWTNRENFKHINGKYDLVHRDYSTGDDCPIEKQPVVADAPAPPPESKLHGRVQSLVELLFNVRAMEEAVISMEYDAKKAPLGKLTKQQVLSGYAALKEIEQLISRGKASGPELSAAVNTFYTRIPHNFGMNRPPLINSMEAVQRKVKLLEALGEIEIAMTALAKSATDVNPLDAHYAMLKCDLSPIRTTASTYHLVAEYLANTHAPTHNQYRLKLVDLFEVHRHHESERFVGDTIHNHQLLWHGSRTTNFVGILSQGLRIAPPEAPSTGYMFGKGVYFADMVTKSANYCYVSRQNNTGCLLLCEVALGNTNDLTASDFHASKLPKGTHSTKGLGGTVPDPAHTKTIDDGKVVVPLGKGVPASVGQTSLLYNEYIVYDVAQIRIRYMLRVQFDYNARD